YNPVYHVIKIISVFLTHHLLKAVELLNGCAKLFHFFSFFGNLVCADISFFKFFYGTFGYIFISIRQIVYVGIYSLSDEFGSPSFAFHCAEEIPEIVYLKINISSISF